MEYVLSPLIAGSAFDDAMSFLSGFVNDVRLAKQYYRLQQETINEIYYMKKPVISFIHGRAHGVGAAMALFQTIPTVTPSAVISATGSLVGMSGAEAGLSYLFSRLTGHMGEFLLLTGKNLTGSDIVKLGLAKFYFRDPECLTPMQEMLSTNGSHEIQVILPMVSTFHFQPEKEGKIENYIDIINDCFSRNTIADIIAALLEYKFRWTTVVAGRLSRLDPVIATATLLACRRARNLSIGECLEMEFALACRLIDRPNWSARTKARLTSPYPARRSFPKLSPEELMAKAEALLAPLPEAERLNLPVKRNLEHYERRPDIHSELDRAHEHDPITAMVENGIREAAGEIGRIPTRPALRKYILKVLKASPELQDQYMEFMHQVDQQSTEIIEGSTFSEVAKETST